MQQIIQEKKTTLILECIDEALDDFGKGTSEIVYAVGRISFGMPREQITEKPETFRRVLERIFGASSIVIEKSISKNLVKALDHASNKDSKVISDLIFELSREKSVTSLHI